ncbi:SAM and SH3 domain-containing protein 1-like [Hypomesus transpacificus]|uniref:SAM and SH3 domain-containing protein 1-like n=1 Tax=Hypomesus transpacificus TaxID=137520 RepID=UPI001F07A2F9|nr:SAM and SH3 domain-containing protein 1-like [Hypomesus transpacificus]
MNFFCFSLEGSTDSLYEPNQGRSLIRDLIPPCTRSPSLPRNKEKWRGSDPNLSSEQPQAHPAHSRKKKKRSTNKTRETTPVHLPSHVPTSTLENETTENTDRDPLSWQTYRDETVSVFTHNNPNEEAGTVYCQSVVPSVEHREKQLNLERREKDPLTQGVNFEAWKPNYEHSDCNRQDLTGEAEEELKGTLKRIQRLVKVKKGSGSEEGKTASDSSGHLADNVFKEDSPVITCIGLSKKTDKKPVKAASSPQRQPAQESSGGAGEGQCSLGAHAHRWSPTEVPPPWDPPYHTCPRLRVEHQVHGLDFTLPRATDWERFESLVQELDSKQALPPRVIRSITDVDISDSMRTSSYGRFNGPTLHASPTRPKYEGTLSAGREHVGSDQTSPGSLGRRIKAVSHTMCKRMGNNHVKPLSGETGQSGETESSEGGRGGADGGRSIASGRWRSSNSLGSLYSLNSGQSSSSGVTSGSDGFSHRDILRLDEDPPYPGQFCGRARVHTDFVPSPYDTESLKLKVGDTIDIISKPPMGIWTGILNGKLGNFKFVYVDVLVDKEPELPQKMRPPRKNPPSQPGTLHELLTRLNLEEYVSPLLLSGYHTVEDLRQLRDQHLMELNVTDLEHRRRLLAAFHCLKEPQWDDQKGGRANQEAGSPTASIKTNLNDHPRDSGCYMPTDCCDAEQTELPSGYPSLTVS